MGSALILFAPPEKSPTLGMLAGLVMVPGCLWVIDKCIRLITAKRNSGGLIGPRSLRAVAVLFLLMPLGGHFSGYFRNHALLAIVQTAVYICVFIGLRKLAARRESSDA
jgi:hypothetical protein